MKILTRKKKVRVDKHPFKCPYSNCPRRYMVEERLNNHIKTYHNHGRET